MANGPAGVRRSLSRTLVSAVVISADFASAADHSGCACLSRAKDPATTGLDIEVPAMAWKSWPARLGSGVGAGVSPARICTPGAVMSGLIRSRRRRVRTPLEKDAIDGVENGAVPTPG